MRSAFRMVSIAALLAVSPAEAMTQPQVRVAVILDGSGSFRARRQEAVVQAARMLDELAKTKLHRWEPGADEIAVLSLDAIPEIIWRGDLRALKQMPANAWAERFAARKDFTACTDVTTAFRIATDFLGEGDAQSKKYLLAFSDLVSEAPTGSVRTCKPAQGLPDEEFPWAGLAEVAVSVYWVPADQKLKWKRAVKDHDLESSFALFATGESSAIEVKAPPRPKAIVTQEEKEVAAGWLRGLTWLGTRVIGLFIAIAMGGAGLVIVRKKIRSRRIARKGRS